MKHLFLTITAIFCLFSCDTTAQKKNDLQRQNLKGKVKSVKQFSYEAVEKFGEITKGINIGWSEDDNSLSLYDDKGNLIEGNWYNPDGTLGFKSKYQYNDKGNKIEENSHNPDGRLGSKYKYQYKYDQQGNWTEQIEYENDIPQKIKERTIEYYD